MSKFKPGDLVYLSENSMFWEECSLDPQYENPRYTAGIVKEIEGNGQLNLVVCWINGQENVYSDIDLECVNEEICSDEADMLRMLHGV